MIKQITVSNLYNFKEEITIDFTIGEKGQELHHTYNNEKIGNFSLIYGKNNVGKSNFFRILKEVKKFVFDKSLILESYNPSSPDNDSLFEILVENNKNEIRYGFVVNIEKGEIKEEWLFSKIDGSNRESKIFDRNIVSESSSFSSKLKSSEIQGLKGLRKDVLFLSHLSDKESPFEVIDDMLNEFKEMMFYSCLVDSEGVENIPGFFSLYENDKYNEVINLFLESADLDIVNIKFSELTKDEDALVNTIREIEAMDLPSSEKEEKMGNLVKENLPLLPTLLRKNLMGKVVDEENMKPISMEFIHRSGASYKLEDLSTGTKQIISILIRVIENIGKRSVMIFDEIETGLHSDLLDLLLSFFTDLVRTCSEQQYIITTHREELLDYEFISNENKVFLKFSEDNKDLEVHYLSEYRLRDYQLPSKRYKLNAFQTNPNTSKEYNLTSYIKKLISGQDKNG